MKRLTIIAGASLVGSLLFLCIAGLGRCELDEGHAEELPGHMQPLGSHRPAEGEIERINHIPDPVSFHQEYVNENKPVVLEGAISGSPPLTTWTDKYLKLACMGGQDRRQGDIMCLGGWILPT